MISTLQYDKYIPWAAPLAGVSDSPFRIIAKKFGAQIVFSEMVSTEGLVRKQKNTIKMLKVLDGDDNIAIQFFGKRPEAFSESIKFMEDNYSYVSTYNLNAGCPVKKVVRNGCGVCLMKDPILIGKIISSMKSVSNKPVSVKIRSGLTEDTKNALECAKIAEAEGADFIILHPRTSTQMFSGHSDWSLIKTIKDSIKIPVIGNGDITNQQELRDMLNQTTCDATMIGRASIGNPWIFKKEIDALSPSIKTRAEVMKTSLEHMELAEQFYGPTRSNGLMKKHMIQYAHKSGFRNSEERKTFNDIICSAKKLDEQRKAIQKWASQ